MLRLCDSILVGQREMAQMIIDGLRPKPGRSVGLGLHDPGIDGDVEEDHPRPSARKTGAPKRRSASENMLSVGLPFFHSRVDSSRPSSGSVTTCRG
jgi:hypothetical protein